MTTVLPSISLTPFRNHFDRKRHDFLLPSPAKASPIPSSNAAAILWHHHNSQNDSRLSESHSKIFSDKKSPQTPSTLTASNQVYARVNEDYKLGKEESSMQLARNDKVLLQRTAADGTVPIRGENFRADMAEVSPSTCFEELHEDCKQDQITRYDIRANYPVYKQPDSGDLEFGEPFPILNDNAPDSEPVDHQIPVPVSHHRHRLSDASSVYVRSMRTASMSNRSLSLFRRSSNLATSSDAQSLGVSSRFSTDSHSLKAGVSPDAAALARAVKRRYIFNEILETEESYVADLKALLYLYSTLLATNVSIPNSDRTAIQQNVAELLSLHESILDRLRLIAHQTATRKWAAKARTQCQAVDPAPSGKHLRRYGGGKTSIEFAPGSLSDERAPITDAADILGLANALKDSIGSFVLYEEYCANYTVLTDELRRQLPNFWSNYQAGIESLARVLNSIERRSQRGARAATINDLLIQPIQRVCRYPLLLNDLRGQMSVDDGPEAHETLENVSQCMHDLVDAVDMAADDQITRLRIQKRIALRNMLDLAAVGWSTNMLRQLGHVYLCGVLHTTYRTFDGIQGSYCLCALFDQHVLIALPVHQTNLFEMFALIGLNEATTRSCEDGKGLQCLSALYTFKLCFVADDGVHEILLSACSAVEEQKWISGLEGEFQPSGAKLAVFAGISPRLFVDLKPIAKSTSPKIPLSRQSSIQRAATIGSKPPICHVILRNTSNPQDLQEFRSSSAMNVGRSLSHASAVKTVILAPKRSERARLEAILNNVWTKDKLPYPGMIVSKGSQILRASAGTLVRKLSLASIQAPFSKKTPRYGVTSKASYDMLTSRVTDQTTGFSVKRRSLDDATPIRTKRPDDVPELDTMNHVIGRMIGDKRLSFSGRDKDLAKRSKVSRRLSSCPIGPEDPAAVFYDNGVKVDELVKELRANITSDLDIKQRKFTAGNAQKPRGWGHSISRFKALKSGGLKNVLHTAK